MTDLAIMCGVPKLYCGLESVPVPVISFFSAPRQHISDGMTLIQDCNLVRIRFNSIRILFQKEHSIDSDPNLTRDLKSYKIKIMENIETLKSTGFTF